MFKVPFLHYQFVTIPIQQGVRPQEVPRCYYHLNARDPSLAVASTFGEIIRAIIDFLLITSWYTQALTLKNIICVRGVKLFTAFLLAE